MNFEELSRQLRAKAETLDDAYDRLRAAEETLKTAQEDVRVAREELNDARGDLYEKALGGYVQRHHSSGGSK